MKNFLIVMLMMLMTAGMAFALPMTQQEAFLNGNQSVTLSQGQSAVFNFDFVNQTNGATTDALGFLPGSSITSALLGVTISSADLLPERIVISSGAMDGDTKLLDKTLFLGNFSWFQMSPASKIFTIDLKQAGLEEYLKDGLIQVSVLAGDLCWNDFSLNEIGINMTSVAPVPEPGTMALFSVGLLGIAVYGKRRTNKMTA